MDKNSIIPSHLYAVRLSEAIDHSAFLGDRHPLTVAIENVLEAAGEPDLVLHRGILVGGHRAVPLRCLVASQNRTMTTLTPSMPVNSCTTRWDSPFLSVVALERRRQDLTSLHEHAVI